MKQSISGKSQGSTTMLLDVMVNDVSVIRLENGDEALYLYGQCLVCNVRASDGQSLADTGRRLASILSLPFQLICLPVPEDEAWCWNDIVSGPFTA